MLGIVELGAVGMKSFVESFDFDFVLVSGCNLNSGVASNQGCMCSRKDRDLGCWTARSCHPEWRSLVLLYGASGTHRWDVLPMSRIRMP